MPDGFLLGAVVTACLLGTGIALGLWIGRKLPSEPSASSNAAEIQPVLKGLMQFTDDFSRDVSEYRALIDVAVKRAREVNGNNTAENSGGFLAQILEANDHLQRRLDDAESTLQMQASEITAFMNEARTDALTQLPNRRAFDDEFGRRLAAHRRQNIPCTMLLVDVDRFKSVNDRYGHQVGDEVLKAVADALRKAARETDLVARYGGEEFAVLVAGNTEDEFRAAAERMRRAVEEAKIVCSAGQLQATVSGGVAAAVGEEDEASLVRRADEALYASKSGGRNCVHWHDGRHSIRIASAISIDAARPQPESLVGSSESFRDVCTELRKKLLDITK